MNFIKETINIKGVDFASYHKETASFNMRRNKASMKFENNFEYKGVSYYITCSKINHMGFDATLVERRKLSETIELIDVNIFPSRNQEIIIRTNDSYLELNITLQTRNNNEHDCTCHITITEWEIGEKLNEHLF